MRSKCSFILKASTALVLCFLMLFGTVATSIAAVVDNYADTGAEADLADEGAEVDLAESGWAINGGKVYFVKPSTWTNGVQLLYSLNNGTSTKTKTLGLVTGSLYYIDYGSSFESKDLAYIDASGWGDENNTSVEARKAYAPHRSWTKNSAWDWYNSGVYYLITMNSGDADSDFSQSYDSSKSNLALTKTQTVDLYTDGSKSNSGGSVTISGKQFNGDNAVQNASATSSSSSVSLSGTVITSPVTLSASANAGYDFDGFYTSTTWNTSQASSYNVSTSSNTKSYAKFTSHTYTITYKDEGNEDYSGSNGGSLPNSHTYNTATDLVDGERSGYNFLGWYTDEDCTDGPVTSLGATAYTADITLYAKWEEIGTCLLDLSSSSATLDIGDSEAITVSPNAYHSGTATISAASSSDSIATASYNASTGKVTITAVSHGNATVTVSCSDGSSATIAVTVNTPTVTVALTNSTRNIGETTTATAGGENHGTAAATYASSDTSVATVDASTGAILAKAPGTTDITATVDGVTSSAATLTVSTPTVSSYSYSTPDILIGQDSVAPTVSVSNAKAGSTITYQYALAENTYATINTTTGVITAKSTYAAVTSADQKAKVRATINPNVEGVAAYTTDWVQTDYSVYAYFLMGLGGGWTKSAASMFTYDSSRSVWSNSRTLTAQTYSGNTNGFKVVKYVTGTLTYYDYTSTITMTRSSKDNKTTALDSDSTGNFAITADVAGTYIFDLALTNDTTPSTITPHYPQIITYSKNGITTTAFPSTTAYVTYNTAIGSAPATEPAANGYRFLGWKEAGEDTAFDFANTKITAATTINAQWEEKTAGIALTAYTDDVISTTGGTIQIGGSDVTEVTGVGITTNKTIVANVKTAQGYLFAGWEKDGANADHILIYTNAGCSTPYTGSESPLPTTIYIKTDGTEGMTTSNSIIKAKFIDGNRTLTASMMVATDNTGYTTGNAAGLTPSFTGAGAHVVGDSVTLTAPDTYTQGGNSYEFVGWYSAATDITDASFNYTPVSSNTSYTFTLGVSSHLKYYAMYKKVYYLTFYNTWINKGTDDTPNWVYMSAPPRTVKITTPGAALPYATYTYQKSTTLAENGEEVIVSATGYYHEGNSLKVLAGDNIAAAYSALASSDNISGIFFNNAIRYSLELEPDNKYNNRTPQVGEPNTDMPDLYPNGYYEEGDDDWKYNYLAATTLHADAGMYDTSVSPYSNIIGQEYEATIDQNTHTVSWSAKSNYLNIDMELATKKRIVFSSDINDVKKTEKTTVVHSKNADNYYYIGEEIGDGTSDFYVAAKKSSNQTNIIDGTAVKFYKLTEDGKKGTALTDEEIDAAHLEITAETSTSTSGANGTSLYITGNMPAYDIYVDLGVVTTYAIQLDSKMQSDTLESKTKFNQVAVINATGGSANLTQAFNDSTPGTLQGTSNVTDGSTITLSYTYQSATRDGKTVNWSDYYMFIGWYKGKADGSGPDLDDGPLSEKDTFSYRPTGNCTIWAVGTRDLFINGSRYITGKSTDWNRDSESDPPSNLKMDYDPSLGTKGKYYWEIDSTIYSGVSSTGYTVGAYYSYDQGTGAGSQLHWGENDSMGNSWFQFMDTASTWDRSVWSGIGSFEYTATDSSGNNTIKYGKALKKNDDDFKEGCGFIHFNETTYAGYSTPLRIYYDPATNTTSVESTPVYPHIYLSNGYKNIDEANPNNHPVTYTINGAAASSSNRTENGSGWTTLANESTVRDITIKARNATVEFSKVVASADYKVSNFVVYNLFDDSVTAYEATQVGETNEYKASIKTSDDQPMYVVPIIEYNKYTEDIEKMTVIVDALQLDTAKWGDLVGCYAWYSSGDAYGAYPGQLMVPSTDGLSWKATFPSVNPSNPSAKLVGITFSNYLDGSNTWLGGDTVLTRYNSTGPIFKRLYNEVTGTDNGAGTYDKTNYKCQTYDYREPIAYFTNKSDAVDEMLLTFALKGGNADLITWRHGDLEDENIKTFQQAHPTWSDVNFEYLLDASGEHYTDINGVSLGNEKPTPSFYVVAKGMNVYKSSNLAYSFWTGKNYDTPAGVSYTGYANAVANEVDLSYAVQWYVYDASGAYITTVLSAGYADRDATHTDKSLIGQTLLDMGYPVDGRSVAISYDVPRYCYSTDDGADGVKNTADDIPNHGNGFDAYRYTGQWYEQDRFATARVYAKIGMKTDNGYDIKDASSGYFGATATVSVNPSVLNHTDTGQYGTGSEITDDGTINYAYTTIVDGERGGITLTASSQNFKGWYYYDNENKLQLAKEDPVFHPSYSKRAEYIAIYEAKAYYKYNYTGREGAENGKSYIVTVGDLTNSEISAGNKLDKEERASDFNEKAPGASKIKIWKKDIDFSSWGATDNTEDYFLKKTCTGISTADFNLTYYYKDAGGNTQSGVVEDVTYNTTAVDLIDVHGGVSPVSYYSTPDHRFIGWYDGSGNLLSVQANFGMVLAKDTVIYARYAGDEVTAPTNGWHIDADDFGITGEMTSTTSGTYYYDVIVRAHKDQDTHTVLPDGAEVGILLIDDGGSGETTVVTNNNNLKTFANRLTSGQTGRIGSNGRTVTKVSSSSVSRFGRVDLACRRDYAAANGNTFSVYAYVKVDGEYTFYTVESESTWTMS